MSKSGSDAESDSPQVIDDADFVAAGLGGLNESLGAVKSGVAREDDEIHEDGGVEDGWGKWASPPRR